MKMSVRSECGTCGYWAKQQGQQGICRRYPPTVVMVPGTVRPSGGPLHLPGLPSQQMVQVEVQSMFPPMMANGYCGEWAPTLALEAEFRQQTVVDAEVVSAK